MRIDIRKLYQGLAELRDYDVRALIQKGEAAEIYYKGEKMTIPADELPLRTMTKSKLMKSSTGGKDYHLIGFEWIPDQIEL